MWKSIGQTRAGQDRHIFVHGFILGSDVIISFTDSTSDNTGMSISALLSPSLSASLLCALAFHSAHLPCKAACLPGFPVSDFLQRSLISNVTVCFANLFLSAALYLWPTSHDWPGRSCPCPLLTLHRVRHVLPNLVSWNWLEPLGGLSCFYFSHRPLVRPLLWPAARALPFFVDHSLRVFQFLLRPSAAVSSSAIFSRVLAHSARLLLLCPHPSPPLTVQAPPAHGTGRASTHSPSPLRISWRLLFIFPSPTLRALPSSRHLVLRSTVPITGVFPSVFLLHPPAEEGGALLLPRHTSLYLARRAPYRFSCGVISSFKRGS